MIQTKLVTEPVPHAVFLSVAERGRRYLHKVQYVTSPTVYFLCPWCVLNPFFSLNSAMPLRGLFGQGDLISTLDFLVSLSILITEVRSN